MNKAIFLIVMFLTITSYFNVSAQNDAYRQKIFGGKHELLKFNQHNNQRTTSSGVFFLIGGSSHSETTVESKVRFMWKIYTGEYIVSEIDVRKIRIIINNSVKSPYITLHMKDRGMFSKGDFDENSNINLELMMYCNYITVYCSETDCPKDINFLSFK